MRKVISRVAGLFVLAAITLTACKKDNVPQPPPPPAGNFAVKVKAAVTVGEVVYDSIPAALTITSWDRSGVQHQTVVQLAAGTNTVYLPKAHTRYQMRITKWGITGERTLQNSEVSEETTYILGGSKAAKKLTQETGYVFENGNFLLNKKLQYSYDAQGRLKEIQNYYMDNSQSTPHLTLSSVDRFIYNGSQLEKIETINKQEPGEPVTGYNTFSWGAGGKVAGIQYGDPAQQSSCRFFYPDAQEANKNWVHIDYFLDNFSTGSRVELKFAGGNRVEEKTLMPNYQSTTKTFTYDGFINPYVHLSWPRFNLAYHSKNNVLEEHHDNINSYVKNEYAYDADGYTSEVVKTEMNPATNQARAMMKIVYTY